MQKLILLIDDDKEEYHILSSVLEMMNKEYACTWMDNVDQAYQYLEEVIPDYIFVDLHMPKTDGLTCIKTIREMNKLQDIPVILYSNSIDEQVRANAMQIGSTYVLKKNGSIAELLKKLEHLFGTRETLRGHY